MQADNICDLRKVLDDQGVIFCYCGYVTESILNCMGEVLKERMKLENADTKTIRSVFGNYVEQMQNIIRYSAEWMPAETPDEDSSIRFGLIAIGVSDSVFYVTCGNKVLKRDVERLRGRLVKLREMESDGLKALYKETLRGPTEATSKGAGVGLIEIARRSTRAIEFDFIDIDADHAFFCLKSYV